MFVLYSHRLRCYLTQQAGVVGVTGRHTSAARFARRKDALTFRNYALREYATRKLFLPIEVEDTNARPDGSLVSDSATPRIKGTTTS